MRAFKQQAFAALVFVVQRARHVGNHRQHARAEAVDLLHHIVKLNRRRAVQMHQLHVIQRQIGAHFFGNQLHVKQIARAHRPPRHFVFVGRTNAAPCGADFFVAFGLLAGLV